MKGISTVALGYAPRDNALTIHISNRTDNRMRRIGPRHFSPIRTRRHWRSIHGWVFTANEGCLEHYVALKRIIRHDNIDRGYSGGAGPRPERKAHPAILIPFQNYLLKTVPTPNEYLGVENEHYANNSVVNKLGSSFYRPMAPCANN